MILNFLLTWFGLYWLVITAMFIDNLCWISSSPEFSKVKNYSLKDYLKYCFKDRIWAVIKDYRDIFPAIVTSLALTVCLLYNLYLGIAILGIVLIKVIFIIRKLNPREG